MRRKEVAVTVFRRLVVFGLFGIIAAGALLFLPAWTFAYWQGWVFLAVFTLITWVPGIRLLRTNPAALERRMHSGPRAETRPIQKVAVSVASLSMMTMIVVSVFDHRYGWSSVPAAISLAGEVVVATGLGIAMLVIFQNNYAAATITVEPGQKLASTGLYKLVRHPMYAGNVIMMAGIPLALGSYWGLVFAVPGLIGLVIRINDEEKLLAQDLPGYREYLHRVR
ncbi:MAG: isoprenylcysteine carboxylmethyltransferase family protein, partial [Mycobacteriaceae bacterium]|nr:isoprenylcysteine carboxylmethyltransferase family protein [Mycobacteriaceae bacterium]